jgi:Ca-activated chloride channel homolog
MDWGIDSGIGSAIGWVDKIQYYAAGAGGKGRYEINRNYLLAQITLGLYRRQTRRVERTFTLFTTFMPFSSLPPYTAFMILARALRFSGVAFLLPMAWNLDAQGVAVPAAFRTNAQMVLVPVTVTDHSGKTIEGLGAKDFNIFEDRAPRQIVSFTAEDAPCSVGLVLDISGSMRYTLDAAKSVAHSFLETANSEDEFLLLTVSTQPDTVSRFTTNIADLEDSIGRTSSGGMTALIDTVYLGLNDMRKAHQPRRALLILSDGMDNYSRYSKGELMRVALEADVQIYAIIVGNGSAGGPSGGAPFRPSMVGKPIDQAREREGPNMLEELAEKTGGLYFHAHDSAEAKEAAAKAGRALRNEYVIGYQPSSSGAAGKWHEVRVKTNVPKVHVYARNGYYAP